MMFQFAQSLSLFPDWILTHGAASLVVIPILAAVLTALNPSAKLAWATVLGVTALCTFTALGLLLQVLTHALLITLWGGGNRLWA